MPKSKVQFMSVDRIVAIFRPKQAFVDWVNSMPDDPNTLTLDQVSHENICLLVPEYESNERGREFILKHSEGILELQLSGWDQSGETWPEKLDRHLLQQFFDIEIHSMVIDTMKDDIEKEEYDI